MIKAYLIAFGIGLLAGCAGALGITKAVKPEIKLECPPPVVNLKCPDAVNTIDFDKIKGFKGNITLDQHYHVEMNGDSLVVKQIISEMEKKLNELRLARCR